MVVSMQKVSTTVNEAALKRLINLATKCCKTGLFSRSRPVGAEDVGGLRVWSHHFLLDTSDALAAWHAVNNAQLTVIADSHPVSKSIPNSLQFSVPSGSSGDVGFTNEGFWGNRLFFMYYPPLGPNSCDAGIKVDSSWAYKASFYYRFPASSTFCGTLTAGLKTNRGTVLAQGTTQISGMTTGWTHVNFDLKPTSSAPDNDNSFFISVDGAEAAGQTINFAMLSLFPPTFKDRPNGMRIDIAEVRVFSTRQNRKNSTQCGFH